jgi:hypothetical protein
MNGTRDLMPGSKRGSEATILGVNRTQDASICLIRGSRVVCSIQKERLTRQKHHWGKLDDFRNVYAPGLRELDPSIDYSSNAIPRSRDGKAVGL